MITVSRRTPNGLKGIYNRCSEEVSFDEALILHAIGEGSTTVRELKDSLSRNRPYILRTISALKERGLITEKPGKKLREYTLTDLGLKPLILLRLVTDNLKAEKDVARDELVERIKKFHLDEESLKYLKISYG